MGALLVSRLLHPLGMYAAPNTLQFRVGRVGGITITYILLIACALTILARVIWSPVLPARYCKYDSFNAFDLILTL